MVSIVNGRFVLQRSLRFASILSFFDIRCHMNPFLAKSDLIALAMTNSFIRESVELMFQLHWYECPRITHVSIGSLDHHFMVGAWNELTNNGKTLPCSGSLHLKLLQTARHRSRLAAVQSHSRVWLDDAAFGHLIRLLGTMFVGLVRRDADAFHDIAALQDDYEIYSRGRRYRPGHPAMSRIRCGGSSHDEDELRDIWRENSAWWFRVVVRFLVSVIRELNKGYTVMENLDIGDISIVALKDHRLTRIDCFNAITHARVLFNIAEPLAMAAVTSAFI
jgi:hypothetical protein